jgi:hypothetical protein
VKKFYLSKVELNRLTLPSLSKLFYLSLKDFSILVPAYRRGSESYIADIGERIDVFQVLKEISDID